MVEKTVFTRNSSYCCIVS